MHRPVEVSLGSGTYPFWSCFKAEFLKAFATRLPQIAYAAIFGLVFLFVFQAYHMGGLNEILAEDSSAPRLTCGNGSPARLSQDSWPPEP